MMEFIIIFAFIGSFLAAIYDLKTTEVPEDVPYLMIAVGLFYWFVTALTYGDFYPLFLSIGFGFLLLIVGLLLYRRGQWGEADAWLLAAIAFMIPVYNGRLFMPDFVTNLFMIGAVYTVLYALALGLKHRTVFGYFLQDLRKNAKLLLLPLAFVLAAVAMTLYGIYAQPLLLSSVLFFFLMIFWFYGKVIENKVFRKRIESRHLKEGDVLDNMLWRGITKDEIKDVSARKKYVIIKEGVRFIPVFPITLLVTIFFGSIIFPFF